MCSGGGDMMTGARGWLEVTSPEVPGTVPAQPLPPGSPGFGALDLSPECDSVGYCIVKELGSVMHQYGHVAQRG